MRVCATISLVGDGLDALGSLGSPEVVSVWHMFAGLHVRLIRRDHFPRLREACAHDLLHIQQRDSSRI